MGNYPFAGKETSKATLNSSTLALPMHAYEPVKLEDIINDKAMDSLMVMDSFTKAQSIYSKPYEKIFVGVSGGSDSDLVVDICKKLDPYSIKTKYVWANPGLEYKATMRHLDYLEERYGIKIERIRPKMPIPLVVRKYGQPFLSKLVSEFMYRLQLHDFKWEDEPYDVLIKRYPRSQSALEWWCDEKGEGSRYSIRRNKYLKEFIIANPPTFKIANKCCQKSKKDALHEAMDEYGADLDILGIRKAEGGARGGLNGCFVSDDDAYDVYRPIFWYQKEDKKIYEEAFDIKHSECYGCDGYGLNRTGCACCPFGLYFEEELSACDKYEPQLSKAARNIFKDSYEYTRKYREFVKMMDAKKDKVYKFPEFIIEKNGQLKMAV